MSRSHAAWREMPSPWSKTTGLGHAEFLELVLTDEVTRRDTTSADLRARTAGLDRP